MRRATLYKSTSSAAGGKGSKKPLVVCVVSRPLLQERITPEFEAILRHASGTDTQLHLRPLGERERRVHLCHSLRVRDVPELVADVVSDLAAGNPQYIELVATGLVEGKLVKVEDGDLKVVASESMVRRVQVPSKMKGGVMGQYDHLTKPHQEVVKVAAVCEEVFSLKHLRLGLNSVGCLGLLHAVDDGDAPAAMARGDPRGPDKLSQSN